jgi:hypothetical protein
MTTEASLIDSALRSWQQNVDRAGKFFASLTEDQLLQSIAPGKNRLIYLWGHLTAVNDAMLPLLALGTRLHPELDEPFVKNPDHPSQKTFSGKELQRFWDETNQALWAGFTKLSPAEWSQKHTAVSEEDFQKESYRNRFSVLLSRNAHLGYHLGQAILTKP